MIRTNILEEFPITVILEDEDTGKLVSYDIRQQSDDLPLSPPLSGALPESSTMPGLYTKMISINVPGSYIVYITCSGFLTSGEEIIVDFISGAYIPEVISEDFGSVNMTADDNNIKFSTKQLIPNISIVKI